MRNVGIFLVVIAFATGLMFLISLASAMEPGSTQSASPTYMGLTLVLGVIGGLILIQEHSRRR